MGYELIRLMTLDTDDLIRYKIIGNRHVNSHDLSDRNGRYMRIRLFQWFHDEWAYDPLLNRDFFINIRTTGAFSQYSTLILSSKSCYLLYDQLL